MSETVRFTFEGKPLEGRHGESLAAALVSAGIVGFRETRGGEMRGMFCGMGVCQDCLLEVDGKPNQRACMTRLEGPTTVRPGIYGRALPEVASGEPPKLIDAAPEERPEVLVVGAGPGGLSAAIAAQRLGAQVTVLDERAEPGGQYFKQMTFEDETVARPDRQHVEGARLASWRRKRPVSKFAAGSISGAHLARTS